MAEKKISFGLKPLAKSNVVHSLIRNNAEKKDNIELIQCLEDRSIKVVEEKEAKTDLVIPLLNSQKTSVALASLRNLQNVLHNETDETQANQIKSTSVGSTAGPSTIEQRVINELLNDASEFKDGTGESENILKLPLTEGQQIDGAKESNADDYDRIPIAQFGMAMLRGMGLTDKEIIAAQNKEPELRPKGMGLGADKVIKKPKLLVQPSANEVLEIKKNACVKILAGKYKDLYGTIEGLDDQAGRVIVKLALGGYKETLNEFMVYPVTRKEFLDYGKTINSEKYDRYKKKQEEEEKLKSKSRSDDRSERRQSRSRSRDRYRTEHPDDRSNVSVKQEKKYDHDESDRGRDSNRTKNSRHSRSRTPDRKKSEYRDERSNKSNKRDAKYDYDDSDRNGSSNRTKPSRHSRSRSRDRYKSNYRDDRSYSSSKREKKNADESDRGGSSKQNKLSRRSRSRSRDRNNDRSTSKYDRKHDTASNDHKHKERQRKSSSDSSSSDSDDSRDERKHKHKSKKSKKKHKKKSKKRDH